MSVNVKAEKVVFNDLMWQVPEMLQEFKKIGVEESLRKIDGYISSYDLSKDCLLYTSPSPRDTR